MNRIIHRDSISMKHYVSEAYATLSEMELVSSVLTQHLFEANSYMQDDSGQKALTVLHTLVSDVNKTISSMYYVSHQISVSASLLEESDTLL